MTVSDSGSEQQSGAGATLRAWRLARKELREILRDRRTVLTLILMPLLVYPLLGSAMSKGVLNSLSGAKTVTLHVYLASAEQIEPFALEILRGEKVLMNGATEEEFPDFQQPDDPQILAFPTDPDLRLRMFRLQDGISLDQVVSDGTADLGIDIRIPERGHRTPGQDSRPFRRWQLVQRADSSLSQRGVDAVVKRLAAVNDQYIDELVRVGRIPPVRLADFSTRSVQASSPAPSPLVTFIPLVLVLMTMTGAVYPAIDLTAGERERGTMEILVAAPVSRLTLLAGKFVAVLTVALLTASMNLISMFVTLFALGLDGTILGNITFTMVVQVVVLMVVFAAFFSAVLLSISSIARSFKEAQAYLIPLMLISLSPGIFALLPDVQINGILAVTPLLNTVLMGRDLLQGNVDVLMFAIVLISTAMYGVLALSMAARVFGSDAVLYGSSGTWSDFLKRPVTESSVASLPVAMACLATLFSLFIVLGGLQSRIDATMAQRLCISAGTLLFLFVLIPVAFAKVCRVKIQTGFAIHRAGLSAWSCGILFGISLWPYLYEVEIALITEERIAQLTRLFAEFELDLKAVPLWVKLCCLAFAPAICEELFFRGFLQNSIRQRASATLAVLCSAVLFGVFHVIVKDALLFERLLPSTLMGIVLGIVFERSGSVLPGILLHATHNGILLTISAFEAELVQRGIGISDRTHLPLWLFGCSVLPIAMGIWLLCRNNSKQTLLAEASEQQA